MENKKQHQATHNTHSLDSQEEGALKFLKHDHNQLDTRVSNWKKINLRNVGIKLAGLTAVNQDALITALNRIKEAIVIDSRNNEVEMERRVAQQVTALDDNIKQIEQEWAKNEAEVQQFEEGKIPKAQDEVRQLNDELEDLQVEIAQEKDIESTSFISKSIYVVLGFTGLLWIYVFYLSASYSAFFRGSGVENVNDISELFSSVFTTEAFTSAFNFHWLLPIMFLIIGAVLHISLESIDKYRHVKIFSSVMLIVFADAILAYSIELKAHELKYMTGMEDSAYSISSALISPSFYMILIMGSVSVICWSILLNKICNLFSTNKVTRGLLIKQRGIKKKISNQLKEVNGLISKNEELKTGFIELDLKLKQLKEEKTSILADGVTVTYSKSELKNNLLAFYTGWMTVVSAYNYRNLEEKTRSTFINTINGMDLIIPGFNSQDTIVQLPKAS